MKYLSLLIALFSSQLLFAQNITNERGLKIGKWVNNYGEGGDETGTYKIISRNKYDSINEDRGRSRDIIFGNSSATQYYSGGRDDTLISVQDSIWTSQYPWGGYRQQYWVDGVIQWRKDYDKLRHITSLEVRNYLNDTNYTVEYEDDIIRDSFLTWDVKWQITISNLLLSLRNYYLLGT